MMIRQGSGVGVLGAVVLAAHASGAVLWDTGGWDGIGGLSSSDQLLFFPVDQAADDFVLPLGFGGNYEIQAVHGRVISNIQPNRFSVSIFDDSGLGTPGSLITTLSGAPGVMIGSTVINNQSLFVYDVSATGLPVSLAPNARYWVRWYGSQTSVLERTYFASAGNGAVQGLESHYWPYGGPGWVPSSDPSAFGSPTDLSFTIEGVQVPGPAGVALIGGAMLAGASRRRR